MKCWRALGFLLLLTASLACTAVQEYGVEVVGQSAQPRDHFVQGLEIVDGQLYVGTGLYGASRLLRYDMASGALLASRRLERRLFGEGVTVLGDTVYQLTWRSGTLLRYNRADLSEKARWAVPGEGWGLTNDGERLIYSDGSDRLHFLSPVDGRRLASIAVRRDGAPLRLLNELEWIDGRIWANVWGTDNIAIIDPESGAVVAMVDLRGLLPASERRRGTDVLNGIAQDPATGAIWVTGKRWPWRYKIRLTESPDAVRHGTGTTP